MVNNILKNPKEIKPFLKNILHRIYKIDNRRYSANRQHWLAKEHTVRLVLLVRPGTWPFYNFLLFPRLHKDIRSDTANLKGHQSQSYSNRLWPVLYRTFDTRNRMYIFTSSFFGRITVMGPITTFIYIFAIWARFLITIYTFEI